MGKINSSSIVSGNKISAGRDVHIGDVYINSPDYQAIQKAITRLEKLVGFETNEDEREKFLIELNEEREKLEEFKSGVISLAETFQKIVIDSERLKSAKQFFEEGKFKEARIILDVEDIGCDQERFLKNRIEVEKKAKKIEEGLRNNADEYLVLAKLAAINFDLEDRFEKTLLYYQASLKSDRNKDNLFSYAHFLQKHKQINMATPLYEEIVEIYRKLVVRNPEKFISGLGSSLNNLGLLQNHKNEFNKAEQTLKEAVNIRRTLAEKNPQTYLPDLGMTLINLANLQKNKNEFDIAELYYKEALDIYQKIVKFNPKSFSSLLAVILNNLAFLQKDKNELNNAEKSFKEALEIRRKLAEKNPQTYLPDLASTLNNLAILQNDKNELNNAEKSYKEALEIRRKLAEKNPQTYLSGLADTLNNLAILQNDKNELNNAEKFYKEALQIYGKLTESNPQTYLPYFANTLSNFAGLQQKDKNELDNAEKSYRKALKIKAKIAKTNPQNYLPEIAVTQINMGIFYQEYKANKQLSVQFIDSAITNLLPFLQIPYIQNYLKIALEVLKDWGIDHETYMKEKLEENKKG